MYALGLGVAYLTVTVELMVAWTRWLKLEGLFIQGTHVGIRLLHIILRQNELTHRRMRIKDNWQ